MEEVVCFNCHQPMATAKVERWRWVVSYLGKGIGFDGKWGNLREIFLTQDYYTWREIDNKFPNSNKERVMFTNKLTDK